MGLGGNVFDVSQHFFKILQMLSLFPRHWTSCRNILGHVATWQDTSQCIMSFGASERHLLQTFPAKLVGADTALTPMLLETYFAEAQRYNTVEHSKL